MVVHAREVLISRLLIRCRHQPLSKECRHHCSLTAPSHGATLALHWITAHGATTRGVYMGPYEGAWHILRHPKGPQCVGGRGYRGTDIPISGTGSDAAGDANSVPPLLPLIQLPLCQVLGNCIPLRSHPRNGNLQGSIGKAEKEGLATKLQIGL